MEDQFEAPLSYTDEHSTFFIQPNERTYSPIWDYNKYYPMDETVLKYRDLPVLVVKPKAGWPPVEKLYLGEDVIINDPWRWNKDVIKTNENFNVVLPTNDTFTFGETTFDTAGKNMDAINKKLNQ